MEERYPKPKMTPLKWISNFWYYYKWLFLAGLAVFIFILISCVQMCTARDNDVTLLYAGKNHLPKTTVSAVESSSFALSADLNGDGKTLFEFKSFYLHPSPEKLDRLEQNEVNLSYQDFKTEISAGESLIWILDREQYDAIKAKDALVPLSDFLDKKQENALDDYAVLLSDTPLYSLPGFRALPAEAVLCFRSPVILDGFDENSYERYLDLYSDFYYGKKS